MHFKISKINYEKKAEQFTSLKTSKMRQHWLFEMLPFVGQSFLYMNAGVLSVNYRSLAQLAKISWMEHTSSRFRNSMMTELTMDYRFAKIITGRLIKGGLASTIIIGLSFPMSYE